MALSSAVDSHDSSDSRDLQPDDRRSEFQASTLRHSIEESKAKGRTNTQVIAAIDNIKQGLKNDATIEVVAEIRTSVEGVTVSGIEEEHTTPSDSRSKIGPGKLFRNLTAPLNRALEKNKNDYNIALSIQPIIDFSVQKFKSTKAKKGKSTNFEQDLEVILSSQVHERYMSDAGICVASYIGKSHHGKRCTSKAKGKPKDVERYLNILRDYNAVSESSEFLAGVEDLTKVALCGLHFKSASTRLEQHFPNYRGHDVPLHALDNDQAKTYETWASSIVQMSTTAPNSSRLDPHTTTKSTSTARPSNPTKHSPSRPKLISEPSIPKFEPYQSDEAICIPTSVSILQAVVQNLSKVNDRKVGTIYMYWLKPMFGMVKIGYTTSTSEKRIKGWNNACNREYELHQSTSSQLFENIPHARRVETLIHTELQNFRRKFNCNECERHHEEWFEVNQNHAVEVFQKWKNWIQKKPYEDNGTLKPEFIAMLPEMCQPLELTKTPNSSPRPKATPRRSRGSPGVKGSPVAQNRYSLRSKGPSD